MRPNHAIRPRAEAGFVMIEVLVSALVILIVAGAVLSLVTATTHSAADQRQRAAAYSVAQEDQARLRAMRLSTLNRLNEENEVTLGGTTYTVDSTGTFIDNATGTSSSCSAENSESDYVSIASRVSWEGGRKSVVLNSLVAPSSGSLNPNHGTLLITATNGSGQGIAGLSLRGTGAGTFSGSTDETGCANFSDLPAGNYTLSTEAPGFVDADGNYSPWTKTVGVVAAGKVPVSLMYDLPGGVVATFKYRVGSSSTFLPARADSVVAYNALMPSGAKAFGSAGVTSGRSLELKAEPLFPFKEADTIYAGACESNLPESSLARATVVVQANETIATPQIQLPALNLTVEKGGSPVQGARVTVTDQNCKIGYSRVKRLYSTDAAGHLVNPETGEAEPAMPWGTYEVCASSGERHRIEGGVSVENLTSGTSLTLEIPSNWWEGGSGECSWP